MADVRAIASGNWTNTAIWNTGALPTSADDVWSNTFTITIDTSPTVLSIRNGSTTNVTAGGQFVATNGMTLTCTGLGVVNGTATVTLNSSLTAGQSCSVISDVRGGQQAALNHTNAGTVNITGNVTGGTSSNIMGANNASGGIINITGNVTGGSNPSGSPFGVNNNSTGTVNVTGTCTAHPTAAGGSALNNQSTGIVNHVGTVQAGSAIAGITGTNAGQVTILTGPFLTSSSGTNPVTCARWFWQNTSPPSTYYQIRSANLAVIRPLYTADSVGGNPAVTNVRSGTVYGPSNELTGTCAVPPASAVAAGVPVDNTTGTAIITGAALRAELAPELARMANCATTNEVADIVDGAI